MPRLTKSVFHVCYTYLQFLTCVCERERERAQAYGHTYIGTVFKHFEQCNMYLSSEAEGRCGLIYGSCSGSKGGGVQFSAMQWVHVMTQDSVCLALS